MNARGVVAVVFVVLALLAIWLSRCIVTSRSNAKAATGSGSAAAMHGTTGASFSWQVTPPRIAQIRPASSAAKAGLLVDDLIVAVDGQPVEGLSGMAVQLLLDSHTLGAAFPVTYQRGTTTKTVSIQVEGGE